METPTKHKDTRDTKAEINGRSRLHRALGPGLLESDYEECPAHEPSLRGLSFRRQVPLPLFCKGIPMESCYCMDLVVEGRVIVELKAVEHLFPVHEVQRLTYLRLAGKRLGLLPNFQVAVLTNGIRRVVN